MPRILITRSRHQTSDLATQLHALGAETILIPTIDLAPPSTFTPLDHLLRTPEAFDWLLFTSANAVQALHTRTLTLNLPLTHLHPQIAAIGPATARALTSINLPPNLIPPQAIAESLAAALLPHIAPGRTRMALIRAETARDVLPETLAAAGALLTIIPAYCTIIPTNSIPQLQALFGTPQTYPDAITFTSSSTATNLIALLEAAHLILPPEILRASIGPITSATLRDLGLPPHLEAPESNIPSLVQTLAAHFGLPSARA